MSYLAMLGVPPASWFEPEDAMPRAERELHERIDDLRRWLCDSAAVRSLALNSMSEEMDAVAAASCPADAWLAIKRLVSAYVESSIYDDLLARGVPMVRATLQDKVEALERMCYRNGVRTS